MARPAERIVAKAVGNVLSRHAMARAEDLRLPFDRFAREVKDEVVRLLERRAARELRTTRAVAEMVAALPSAEHRFVPLDPAELTLVLSAMGGPQPGAAPESNLGRDV